jgi:hypothetical protein
MNPMSVSERDDLARELSEYGYSETRDPDARNHDKVGRWMPRDLCLDGALSYLRPPL